MVQMIVYAITMAVIYLVIHHLHSKDNPPKGEENSRYVIRIPYALPAAYSALFWMGIALFVMFGIFYLNGVNGVTVGHFVFSLVCSAIGLLVVIWSSRWRITVDRDCITIHKLLRKERTLHIEDVNATLQEKKTRMGYSGRIVLRQENKKLAAVSWSCENYDRLEKDLIRAGKLPEKKKK